MKVEAQASCQKSSLKSYNLVSPIMKMADGATILRRNRPGTKAKARNCCRNDNLLFSFKNMGENCAPKVILGDF